MSVRPYPYLSFSRHRKRPRISNKKSSSKRVSLTDLPIEIISRILAFNLPSPPTYGVPTSRVTSLDHTIDILPSFSSSHSTKSSYNPTCSKFSHLLYIPPNISSTEVNHFIRQILENLLPSLLVCRQLHIAAANLLAPYSTLLLHKIPTSQTFLYSESLQMAGNVAYLIRLESLCTSAGYPITMARFLATDTFTTTTSSSSLPNYQKSSLDSNSHHNHYSQTIHKTSCNRRTALICILSPYLSHISLSNIDQNFAGLCAAQVLTRLRTSILGMSLPSFSNNPTMMHNITSKSIRRVLTKLIDTVGPSLKELHLVLPCNIVLNVAARIPLHTLKCLNIILRHPRGRLGFYMECSSFLGYTNYADIWQQSVDDLIQRILICLRRSGTKLERLIIEDECDVYETWMPRLNLKELAPDINLLKLCNISTVEDDAMQMLTGVKRIDWFGGIFDIGILENVLQGINLKGLTEIGLEECQIIFPEEKDYGTYNAKKEEKEVVESYYENPVAEKKEKPRCSNENLAISSQSNIVGTLLTDIMNAYKYDHVFEASDLKFLRRFCMNIKKLQLCICSRAIGIIVEYLLTGTESYHLNVLDLWVDGDIEWWRGEEESKKMSIGLVKAICERQGERLIHLRMRGFWIPIDGALNLIERNGNALRTLCLSIYCERYEEDRIRMEMNGCQQVISTLNIEDVRKVYSIVKDYCSELRWMIIEDVDPPNEEEMKVEEEIGDDNEKIKEFRNEIESKYKLCLYKWCGAIFGVSLEKKQ